MPPPINPFAHTSITEYPRPPTSAEYEAIRTLIIDKSYPARDSSARECYAISVMLNQAVANGRFIVSYALYGLPDFGRMIFIIGRCTHALRAPESCSGRAFWQCVFSDGSNVQA